MKPRRHQRVEIHAQGFDDDIIEHVAGESGQQDGAGALFGQTPRAEVEQRVLVELARRSAVAALDIVGVDLQLWL